MSVYALNKIFYLLENDSEFRERIKSSPTAVVAEFHLTPEEEEALTSGNVRMLFDMGVHAFLLNSLSRHHLFGVTGDNYRQRILGQD
jgi:hypothetical protein